MLDRFSAATTRLRELLDGARADPAGEEARWLRGQLPVLEVLVDGGFTIDARFLAHLYFVQVDQSTPLADQLLAKGFQSHPLLARYRTSALPSGPYPVVPMAFSQARTADYCVPRLSRWGVRPANMAETLALAAAVPSLWQDGRVLVPLGTKHGHGPHEHYTATIGTHQGHPHVDVHRWEDPYPAGTQFACVPLGYSLVA